MKFLVAWFVYSLVSSLAGAAVLKPILIQEELGASLGFQIYRFETKLGDGEVMLIRKKTEINGKISETEYAKAGNNIRVLYEIVVVDSNAFNPNMQNTYMLKIDGDRTFINNERLLQWGHSDKGKVEISFANVGGNTEVRKITWNASVEKYADVLKRWPGLTIPKVDTSWSGSSRAITK